MRWNNLSVTCKATPPVPFDWNKARTDSSRAKIATAGSIGDVGKWVAGVSPVCMIAATPTFARETVVLLAVVVAMPLRADPSVRTGNAGRICLM
jgi:hypothetical protein